MKCLHINIRKATFILLSVLINNVHHIQMSENDLKIDGEDNKSNETTKEKNMPEDLILKCPSNNTCSELDVNCINCSFNYSCVYGNVMNATCKPKSQVTCNGETSFNRTLICRYCYQTDPWEHECQLLANCNSMASPRNTYKTNCTVKSDIFCLGQRTFNKKLKCNWTGGHSWFTALALSITLGGFGADRFYLGHWQEGIGKLFSFGGLGVWTIIDVILISLHYLGPADGSLYI